MEVVTLNNFQMTKTLVQSYAFRHKSVTIPCLILGQLGRECKQSIIPISLNTKNKKLWEQRQPIYIKHVKLAETKKGGLKLQEISYPEGGKKVLLLVRISGKLMQMNLFLLQVAI